MKCSIKSFHEPEPLAVRREKKTLTTEKGFRRADVVGDCMVIAIEEQTDLAEAPVVRVQDGHGCVFHSVGEGLGKRVCDVWTRMHVITFNPPHITCSSQII
jgi:hypothetical protein